MSSPGLWCNPLGFCTARIMFPQFCVLVLDKLAMVLHPFNWSNSLLYGRECVTWGKRRLWEGSLFSGPQAPFLSLLMLPAAHLASRLTPTTAIQTSYPAERCSSALLGGLPSVTGTSPVPEAACKLDYLGERRLCKLAYFILNLEIMSPEIGVPSFSAKGRVCVGLLTSLDLLI